MHYWYSSHSPRTQHCNVCRESIPALSRNVIICEGTFLIPLGSGAKWVEIEVKAFTRL